MTSLTKARVGPCRANLNVLLLAVGGGVMAFVYPLNLAFHLSVFGECLAGALTFSLLLTIVVPPVRWWPNDTMIIAGASVFAAALAFGAAAISPISGDEVAYLYGADTILHGRLFNAPPPLPEVFHSNWIAAHGGHRASQYPPGWPVFLAAISFVSVPQLANPVLVGVLGLLLSLSLRRLGVRSSVRQPVLALVLLAPFTLFNGASLFSHLLAAAAMLGVCYHQIRDDQEPARRFRALIGTSFAVLLVTRHDSFVIAAALFVAERIWIRRTGFIKDVFDYSLGGLPIVLLWLGYNQAITGRALLPTMLWAFPDEQSFGIDTVQFLFEGAIKSFSLLFVFGGVLTTALYALALSHKVRRRTVRFYDLMLPGAVLFFVFYPHDPGHQYGPRYWYFAWPTISLTIGPALSEAGQKLWPRLDLAGLATKQIAVFAGFSLVYALFLHQYTIQREAPFALTPPTTPAVVLVPSRKFSVLPWQQIMFWADPSDFTRNGLDFDRPVLYARGDQPGYEGIACGLTDRHIYRWTEHGLQEVACPSAASPH